MSGVSVAEAPADMGSASDSDSEEVASPARLGDVDLEAIDAAVLA
jgi:hypothetical protein